MSRNIMFLRYPGETPSLTHPANLDIWENFSGIVVVGYGDADEHILSLFSDHLTKLTAEPKNARLSLHRVRTKVGSKEVDAFRITSIAKRIRMVAGDWVLLSEEHSAYAMWIRFLKNKYRRPD